MRPIDADVVGHILACAGVLIIVNCRRIVLRTVVHEPLEPDEIVAGCDGLAIRILRRVQHVLRRVVGLRERAAYRRRDILALDLAVTALFECLRAAEGEVPARPGKAEVILHAIFIPTAVHVLRVVLRRREVQIAPDGHIVPVDLDGRAADIAFHIRELIRCPLPNGLIAVVGL